MTNERRVCRVLTNERLLYYLGTITGSEMNFLNSALISRLS